MWRWCYESVVRVTAAKAYGVSAFLHGGALGLLTAWGTLHDQQPLQFAGQRQIIYAEWSAPALPEVPPPVAVDVTPVVERVVIMPRRAEVERHQLVDTPSHNVSPSELLPLLDESPLVAAVPPPATLGRTLEGESREQPQVPPAPTTPLERTQQQTPRPATASAASAVPLVDLGTDAQVEATFVNNAPPRYPEQARRNGWQGTVLLELTVAETGEVTDVRVVQSSGYAVLDAAAVTAIRQWKGQPARRNGQPVATRERLPVRFRL